MKINLELQSKEFDINGKILTFKPIYSTISKYKGTELMLAGIQSEKKNGVKFFKRSNINWSNVKPDDILDVKGFIINATDIESTIFNYHTYNFRFYNHTIYCNQLLINQEVILDNSDIEYLAQYIVNLHKKYKDILEQYVLTLNYKGLSFKIGTSITMYDMIKLQMNNATKK